jgi:hypothetical protein
MDKNIITTKLKNIEARLEALASSKLTLKADCCGPEKEDDEKEKIKYQIENLQYGLDYVLSRLKDEMKYVYEEIQWVYRELREHKEGHLPPINSASQMSKAVDALGLSDEYEVAKKVIYASDGGRPPVTAKLSASFRK